MPRALPMQRWSKSQRSDLLHFGLKCMEARGQRRFNDCKMPQGWSADSRFDLNIYLLGLYPWHSRQTGFNPAADLRTSGLCSSSCSNDLCASMLGLWTYIYIYNSIRPEKQKRTRLLLTVSSGARWGTLPTADLWVGRISWAASIPWQPLLHPRPAS